MKNQSNIKYTDLFWLFFIASYFGLIMEGLYCLIKFGVWENHVVSVYGHLCIIYGIGIVFYYLITHHVKNLNFVLKFLIYAVLGTSIELICGLLLKYGLNMMAWSYENSFLNFMGIICLRMFIIWGILGFIFEKVNIYIEKFVKITRKKILDIIAYILTILLIIDFTITAIAIVRWANRHNYNDRPNNKFEEYIDKKYNDEFMKKRFIEWYFIN